jgi:hypothetical membrane protein
MNRGAAMQPLDRALAGFAFVTVVVFALVCGAVQFLRPDLDPWRAQLSVYLTGDYGALVRAVYYALAAGLVTLGVSAYRASNPARRSAAPLLLFVIAGIALVPVAVTELFAMDGGQHAPLARYVHGVAAETTFLCVTVAMLLQSLWWRRDPAFAHGRSARIVLAVAAFVMLWIHALAHAGPAGLMQKILIALILAWLGLAAWQTQRAFAR